MNEAKKARRLNPKLMALLIAIVIFMSAFGYALVPLYNVLCRTLGINGKTGGQVTYDATQGQIDKTRTVTVQFLATRNADLPWKFYPEQTSIKMHPGEIKKVAYFAKNNTDHTMTVQAIPSVSPGRAANYIKKTECFCFSQQTFKAGQGEAMPLLFHIDPALPKSIRTITLSYTMFDAKGVRPVTSARQGKVSF